MSEVMKISVLGYNFASFIKDFKKAYVQSDGTYDYMGYLAVVDPASYFMLANNLGDDVMANNYLNTLLTQQINNIAVVNGGKKMKGGANVMHSIFIIALLFCSAIQCSLAAKTSNKAKRILDKFNRDNGLFGTTPMLEPQEPQSTKGWVWDTPATKEQLDKFDKASKIFKEQQMLIHDAQIESDKNADIARIEEGKRQTTIKLAEIQADVITKPLVVLEEMTRTIGDTLDLNKNMVAENKRLSEETITINNEFNNFKMAVTLLAAGGTIGMYILYEKNKNVKNIRIAGAFVKILEREIYSGQMTGKVIAVDGDYYTTSEFMNFLQVSFDTYIQQPNPINSQQQQQQRDNLGLVAQVQNVRQNPNQFADQFGIANSRGGKYRKTKNIRKTRKKFIRKPH